MKLWGGNYSAEPDAVFWEFNRSLPFDRRLVAEELAASRAYVRALAQAGAITRDDAARLDAGLAEILAEVAADPRRLDTDDEDVHSWVEARLTETLGDVAGQMHLGRSRNEQSVVALRLWIRSAIDGLREALATLIERLAEKGSADADSVMPGFTHTRPAEPISFGHLAAAHAWAVVRDHERLGDARRRVDVCPLGSGALAGTAVPLDREAIARELGFLAVSQNALDAVMDRDFAAEFVFACAQLQTHLARLAEDLIWHSGPGFGFFTLPEAFTTGSSLMPQKKNPDALELVRGKAARVDGDLLRLLVLMKGLPAGYQKDLQEDKEAVFDAADTAFASVAVTTGVVAGLGVDRDAMRRGVSEEMMAAGLAVALARDGLPFRKAHAVVGGLVSEAQRTQRSLATLAAEALAQGHPELVRRLGEVFDPARAILSRSIRGGTAPDAVRSALRAAVAAVRP